MEVKEAVGSYEGFSVEERQALLELLHITDEDAVVRIEEQDDVSVESHAGIEVIQCKSSIKNGASFLQNSSNDLWKTVARWVERTHSESYGERKVRRYRYSISAPAISSPRGKRIADIFHDVRGLTEAEEALDCARAMVKGSSSSLIKSLGVVFDPEKREAAKRVVDGFTLEHHPDLNDEIRRTFSFRGFAPPTFEASLFHDTLGWLKRRIAEQSQDGNPPTIRYVDFIEHIQKTAEQYRRNPLSETVGYPKQEKLEQVKKSNPIFIRQLHAIQQGGINRDEEDLLAICNWLRSSSQIVRWVEEDGLITRPAVNSYQHELVEAWRLERDDVISDSSGLPSPEQRGRKIYIKTQRESRHKILAGSVPPTFVCDGQLHELADVEDIISDEPRIVWNPSFVERERSTGGAG